MKNKTWLPRLIAFVLSILAIAAMFVPFIKATPEYREYLESIADQSHYETVDFTASDFIELTLYEYARVYWQGGEEILGSKVTGYVAAIIYAAPGFFGILALLSILGKKGKLLMLQSLFVGGSAYLVNRDVIDRGIMPDSHMVWGIAHYIYYPIAVLLLACGIWIFVVKHIKDEQQK